MRPECTSTLILLIVDIDYLHNWGSISMLYVEQCLQIHLLYKAITLHDARKNRTKIYCTLATKDFFKLFLILINCKLKFRIDILSSISGIISNVLVKECWIIKLKTFQLFCLIYICRE